MKLRYCSIEVFSRSGFNVHFWRSLHQVSLNAITNLCAKEWTCFQNRDVFHLTEYVMDLWIVQTVRMRQCVEKVCNERVCLSTGSRFILAILRVTITNANIKYQ